MKLYENDMKLHALQIGKCLLRGPAGAAGVPAHGLELLALRRRPRLRPRVEHGALPPRDFALAAYRFADGDSSRFFGKFQRISGRFRQYFF